MSLESAVISGRSKLEMTSTVLATAAIFGSYFK